MDHLIQIVRDYRKRGLFLDTNLLLLLVVGECDLRAVTTFKRTSAFVNEDFFLLRSFVQYFDRVVTTPNILTEVSSFLNQLSDKVKIEHLRHFAEALQAYDEKYFASTDLAASPYFTKFGLTDSSIIAKAKGNYLVMTDDFRLSNYLQSQLVDVINFNHLRIYNWDISTTE